METLAKAFKKNLHFSWISYGLIFIFYFVLSYLYSKYLFIGVQGLEMEYCVLVLTLFVIVFIWLSSEIIVVKNEHINSMIFFFIPYGIYAYLSYFSYQPALFILLGIGAIIIAGVVTFILIKVFDERKLNRIILSSVTTIIIGFLSMLLILALVINSVLYHNGYFTKTDNTNEKIVEINDLSYLKDKSMSDFTLDEKIEIAKKIMSIEKENLGISRNISLVIKNESNPYKLGAYYESTQILELSIRLLNSEGSFYDLIDTIAHEMYHCYEYDLCYIYTGLEDEQKDLLLFKKVGDYEKNISNYISYEEDSIEYYKQILEEDAYYYGEKRANEYEKNWTGLK